MNGNDESAEEVKNLLTEFDDALATERDSASRVTSAADELADLGVDLDTERPGWRT